MPESLVMPASTFDPVTAALRTSLAKTNSENSLDHQLAGSTKKALLANVDFVPAGSYQTTVLDKLKNKYIMLKKPSESLQASKPDVETLTLPKHELYPLESVQLGWKNADWNVGAGMVNMGNTCYMNSTLQALFHIPALVNWLISDRHHTPECNDSNRVCIICAMRKTLQDSQQRNTNSIRPSMIFHKLRQVCSNLTPGRQEDAHEFLRCLVESMEKSYLNRFTNQFEFDCRTKETTPLNQILGGYLRSAVRCLECGHVSTTFQHFQDLLLDIRKPASLDEALDYYFSREKLDDESYHCESCRKNVRAAKQFSLERAPMVLCIQLKRFSMNNSKLMKHISFRERLELTKFTRHKPTVPLVYHLTAVVTHMGPTVTSGHYTAIAQASCGNFYQFDDSMVRPISQQALYATQAYLLMYELENAPFAQKASMNGINKSKMPQSQTSQVTPESSKVQINGNTSNKPYGPELPPVKLEKPVQNGTLPHANGNKSQPSRENEDEHSASKPESNLTACTNGEASSPSSTPKQPQKSSSTSPSTMETNPKVTSTSQTVTKLVPYDDETSSSEESSSPEEANSRVSTKAAIGEWKVTSTTDTPSTLNSYDNRKNDRTVTELLKMSHSGYSAPVSTWNGTRAVLDREINNEKREERKRNFTDSADQGRVKHIKTCSNGNFKSNPGYNPIQEYQNAKNWNQSGLHPYRHFLNGGNRHRNNKRNFHKNYHKSYRYRQ